MKRYILMLALGVLAACHRQSPEPEAESAGWKRVGQTQARNIKPPNPADGPDFPRENGNDKLLAKHVQCHKKQPNVPHECPINWGAGDSLETLKIKVQQIKIWQAEQNAKSMAVYFGESPTIRLVSLHVPFVPPPNPKPKDA